MARGKHSSKQFSWADYSDDELLDLRFCDLRIRLEDTGLAPHIERLGEELERKGLRFKPHFWLSTSWFTPDGVAGCAIPFYLAHPRLKRLERAQVYEVEGGDPKWCMRLLRHECGHAIDNAFRLRRRHQRREVFGKSSEPYTATYAPRPYSRGYVHHLDTWYAQSHPDEDFAETFAVWLTPRSNWKKRYAGWGAMRKLEYMDELMHELAGKRPPQPDRSKHGTLASTRKTLRRHYAERRRHLGVDHPDYFKSDLARLFSEDEEFADNLSGRAFLRKVRGEARRVVSRWTGVYQYTIDQVIQDMVAELDGKRCWLTKDPDETTRDFISLLTVHTMNYITSESHKVAR